MNKKSWKQKITIILICALITGTIGTNTAFASISGKNVIDDNVSAKANNIESEEEKFSELNEILEECKEVKADKSSIKLRRGEIVSVESITGDSTKMAIMSNGDLYCWSYNRGNGSTTIYQTTPIKVLSNVKSVSCSSSFMLAIMSNGDLYCWDNNQFVKILSDVESVSSYYTSVSAITTNGDLYCWGDNKSGQVGNGSTAAYQTTPVKVLSDVKSVSYYENYSVSAITTNGDLYCWGNNEFGQVGNGSTTTQLTPFKVLSDVKSVSYSYYYYCSVSAITENGDLYRWGDNSHGQVGNGSTTTQLTPFKVLSDVKSVSYSYSFTYYPSVLAITINGDLYCWGDNSHGQVGNGSTTDQLTPFKVLSNVKYVSYSYSYYTSVSAITENGDLYCWGYNWDGQIGNGSTNNQLTPFKVLSDVESVSSYSTSVSVITTNGDLYCWGNNWNGQVGNGSTTTCQTTPVKVLSDVKSVSSSISSSYTWPFSYYTSVSAITANGDLYCWGGIIGMERLAMALQLTSLHHLKC